MRTHQTLTAIAAAALLPLAACGGDAGEAPAAGDPPGAAAPSTPPAQAAGMTMPLTFSPLRDSGVTGAGSIDYAGDSVTVVVQVQGLPGEGSYNAHIHTGTCAEVGGVAVPLTPVTAQADGTGSSTTVFPASDLPMEGTTVVQVHGADGPGATCADIMNHAM